MLLITVIIVIVMLDVGKKKREIETDDGSFYSIRNPAASCVRLPR